MSMKFTSRSPAKAGVQARCAAPIARPREAFSGRAPASAGERSVA